jgi:putative transposase
VQQHVIGNLRRDGLRKLTTRLVTNHDTIVVEDLHVAGMIRNRRPSRAISELGLAELRRQIHYKATDAGVRVIVADRWYPSSKTCSACGAVKAKLTLAQRQFTCESCGTQLDRDHNAARNLAILASQVVHGQLDRDVKQPAGNPPKTATGGTGYRHGKTQNMSQRRPREVATP